MIDLDFSRHELHGLNILQTGGGRVCKGSPLQLTLAPNEGYEYNNVQLDDYNTLRRSQFLWRAPLVMRVRARFSHDGMGTHAAGGGRHLSGTAGFGFWNDPFMMTGWRVPSLPRALWFFYAGAPSNMQLAKGVPGHGFKAAVIDAWTGKFMSLWPLAPVLLPLMHNKKLYDTCWPVAQRAMKVDEALITQPMSQWHDYELIWKKDEVSFSIDGHLHMQTPYSPCGPLGLVAWMDNQYMIVKPTGRMAHGVVGTEFRQTMELATLEVKAL